jgi:hypothetical protein
MATMPEHKNKVKTKDKNIMAKAKRTNYSMNLKADESQSNNWDFKVIQENLKTSRGIDSGIHAVIREDTGIVIGQYSGAKVLPYIDIINAFENGMANAGLAFTRSLFTTGNGARFFGEYTIGELSIIGGEKFANKLRLQSSHDGTLQAGFCFEAMRLACLNGMMLLQTIWAMMKKHSEKLDISFLTDNIQQAIDAGNGHLLETVDRMSDVQISDTQARAILSNIVNMGASKGVSPRAGHVIYDNWRNPSADETTIGNSLYRLYNCATRFTRDIEKLGRFEMSRKANLFITGAFDLAARNPQNLQKLLTSPVTLLDFDGVVVTQ